MTEISFLTYDVFTDRPFGGNPLAVVPDARGVPEALLQTVAREFNLSETVFAWPVEEQPLRRRLRIFTPAAELPFAGHPTVGAAVALAESGALPWPEGHSRLDILLDENAGPVPVRIERRAGRPLCATLTAPRLPERGPEAPDRATLAPVLGLTAEHMAKKAGPACWDAGVRFVILPVRDPEALAAATLDPSSWRAALPDPWVQACFVLTMEDWKRGREVRARMFAPALGIAEDPATGAAAVALAGYLSERQDVPGDGTLSWTIRQGEEMGRPSRMLLEGCFEAGCLQRVRLGGEAVPITRGTIRIPAE